MDILLTDEQWESYHKKYGNLIIMIAKKISGNDLLADVEDNIAELNIAALKSISGYSKKTNKKPEEFLDNDPKFDQYTKSCLWHLKANKGVKLTKRMKFRNKLISLSSSPEHYGHESDGAETTLANVLSDCDLKMNPVNITINKEISHISPEVVEAIMYGDVLTEDGNVSIAKLARHLKVTPYEARKQIMIIDNFFKEKNKLLQYVQE